MQLTDNQLQAIHTDSNRVAVVACPGSGKTTVLTKRIVTLMQLGVSPSSICALTFTNKAAEELKSRLDGVTGGWKVFTGTFHGFAISIIKDFGPGIGMPSRFTIYDEIDRHDIMKAICKETGCKVSKKTLDKAYEEFFRELRMSEKEAIPVVVEYLRRIKSQGAMDFNTILAEAVNILSVLPEATEFYHNRYEHILIDEYQDTDRIQNQLVSSINPKNLYYVADIDQCIYEWRDAQPKYMMEALEDPAFENVRLEETHRCTEEIAMVANRVISKNENRFEKEIKAYKTGHQVNFLSFTDRRLEAEWIWSYIKDLVGRKDVAPEEIFVLARTNRQVKYLSRLYHEKNNWAFKVDDVSKHSEVWSSSSVRAIINSLRLVVNATNEYVVENSVFANKLEIPRLISKSFKDDTSLLYEMELLDPWMEQFMNNTVGGDDVFTVVNRLAHYYSGKLSNMGLDTQVRMIWDLVNFLFYWREGRESSSISTFLGWHIARTMQDSLDFNDSSVKLMTVHAAKGLEAYYVILAGLNKNVFPSRRSDIEEERRLFYVAVTRASERLIVTYEEETPSVFVRDSLVGVSEEEVCTI